MKNLFIFLFFVLVSFNANAGLYIQGENGVWSYQDDGCCVNTYVNTAGTVFHSPGASGTCCNCCSQ